MNVRPVFLLAQIEKETAVKVKKQNECPYTLRLRGGGPLSVDDIGGPKSPFLECKSVMDQMDDILRAYKKAIGPCGEATCPYAQNLAEESCKKMCEKIKSPDTSNSISCKSIPCNLQECPYKENTTSSYPAGCGSPKCAYTKYKLGLYIFIEYFKYHLINGIK
ncbi:hypothetical protein NQ314_012868 [Rhamnusium bicolor]|uniref:Uncharacterized protein n=1 Tax=Rhamnusium bicolor TaxID=1586634 RepID=A0AAV8X9C8_9CUCU|nr:hypothetical protein NQ314_012868 [Rhamnusium bicolor]